MRAWVIRARPSTCNEYKRPPQIIPNCFSPTYYSRRSWKFIQNFSCCEGVWYCKFYRTSLILDCLAYSPPFPLILILRSDYPESETSLVLKNFYSKQPNNPKLASFNIESLSSSFRVPSSSMDSQPANPPPPQPEDPCMFLTSPNERPASITFASTYWPEIDQGKWGRAGFSKSVRWKRRWVIFELEGWIRG
jgi:hypothetical protein